jgi:hypothetical protein
MDWNNGTIFRSFVKVSPTLAESSWASGILNVKLDIGQQELNNKVFIGIENYMIRPNVFEPSDAEATTALQNYWADRTYLQFESAQLTPYIDYSSYNGVGTDPSESRNTSIFARLPLIASPTLGDAQFTTLATFGSDRTLNKDSILYEMRNNPNALANGRLVFRVLDDRGTAVPSSYTNALDEIVPLNYIDSIAFTLVVYKADNQYN